MDLPFTISAGPRQRIYYQVRGLQNSWPHFTVSDSKLPQPGGSRRRTYIPQKQGGSVITPGTEFPFHSLQIKVKVKITLLLAASQSASQSWCRAPSGAHDQILFTISQSRFFIVGRPLWPEDESVFCISCWPLPAQSFSGPSPLGLGIIFYCLRSEASIFVASYDLQVHGGGVRPRLHGGYNRPSL
jgi:hypothetical protein